MPEPKTSPAIRLRGVRHNNLKNFDLDLPLHRLIVTSRVYRQSSRVDEEVRRRDPDNRLLARAPRVRLPAMALRDSALAASGPLDDRVGGAPVYPYQPPRVWESLAITMERNFDYPASHGPDLYRRSLYTFWRRTIAPVNMFDASARQTCRVRTAITSSPLHALTMLNDPTWVEAARVLAQRVTKEQPTDEARLARAFALVLGRAPAGPEPALLAKMLTNQRAVYATDPKAAEALLAEAWASDGAAAAEPPAKGGHKPERPVTASVVVDAAPAANARTSRPAPINWRPEQPWAPRAPRGPVGPLPGSPAGPVERSFAPLPPDYRRPTLSEAAATVFAFGRYEGATVGDVAKRDPGYLVWCADNVRRDQELVRAANVVLDDLEERGAPHPPRGSTRRPTAPLFDPNRELE